MDPRRRHDGRVAAVQFLYGWSLNPPDRLEDALRTFFAVKEEGADEAEGRPRDHYAFGEELVHGVLEHLEDVDARIRELAQNWDFARIAKLDLAILRVAIYEMLYRKDIPPVVSINEAIDISKEFSSADARRFVNGILDRLKDQLTRPARTASE